MERLGKIKRIIAKAAACIGVVGATSLIISPLSSQDASQSIFEARAGNYTTNDEKPFKSENSCYSDVAQEKCSEWGGDMSERKKNTDIDSRSRKEVHERDGFRCVYCGRTDKPIELAHYISRARGGKGIPTNLVSLCIDCHRQFDGAGRGDMQGYIESFFKEHYPDWNEQDQIFRKW